MTIRKDQDLTLDTEKLKDVLTEMGYHLQDRGEEWRSPAVYRDGDNPTSLKIDKKTGQWKDFVTGAYGSIFDLIRKVNPSLSPEEIKQKIGGFDFSEIDPRREAKEKINYQTIYDPKILTRLSKTYKYWKSRGISKGTLDVFNGGFSKRGKMAGRYVFPIYDIDSNIIGFSGRALYENITPKWKHIGNKSQWEYPLNFTLDYVEAEKFLIVVESIGDMLSLWESGIRNTIVTFGVTGLSCLMYKIINLGFKISVSLNDDSKNLGSGNLAGNRAAVFFARQLVSTGLIAKDRIKILPPTKNDFGDMSNDENKKWLENAKNKLQIA